MIPFVAIIATLFVDVVRVLAVGDGLIGVAGSSGACIDGHLTMSAHSSELVGYLKMQSLAP